MVLGNFNAKNKLWFDQDNTSYEGSIFNDLMAQYGLTQIIHEPKHILESSVSCIDLVFTSQENLVTNSGVHSSFFYLFIFIFILFYVDDKIEYNLVYLCNNS